MEIKVMANILDKNDQVAKRINHQLNQQGIFTLNIMGSPGSGKTSLLEQTIGGLKGKYRMAVIEGDLFTAKDATRIQAQGVPTVQINTSGGCHLDAQMIERVLPTLPLADIDLLIIENVGNLVCPAEFALGEDCRATVYSITEGEDKPLKYPLMFKRSAVVLINKIDLLPYTPFNLIAAETDLAAINPNGQIYEISCRTNEGMESWLDWICGQVKTKKKRG